MTFHSDEQPGKRGGHATDRAYRDALDWINQ
jgi:hypothetical protein